MPFYIYPAGPEPQTEDQSSSTVVQALIQNLQVKMQLATKIKMQVYGNRDRKKLSQETLSFLQLATDNFDACQIQIRNEKYPEAIYLFSRGCWNLGEFMGRSKLERAITPSPATP